MSVKRLKGTIRYFDEDSPRTHCDRLETLIKLYVRALKFEVELLLEGSDKINQAVFVAGQIELQALQILTIRDIWEWNDCFAFLFCKDDESGLKGGMTDWSCRRTVGHGDDAIGGGELPTFSMDSHVTEMARTCAMGAIPWSRFHSKLQQAWQAAEPTLRAADIKWTRRPLYDRCENGLQLVEKIRAEQRDLKAELRKLDDWQLDHICILETALRNARRTLMRTEGEREDGPYYPASHYKQFNIQPDTLRQAARKKRIRKISNANGNRNHYCDADVRKCWPNMIPPKA